MVVFRLLILSINMLLAMIAFHASAATSFTTIAEQSGWRETGRYAEVESLCWAWQKSRPKEIRCTSFGITPEGRTMLALVISQTGALTPEAARRQHLPVVLVQGGIHAGEIDGKDAGFLALREMLTGVTAPGALRRQVLVFVPVFNVDGHERFGRWNRPNQLGPEEMGWRTTAQNFNLNRDYAKADSPEMQAMLGLIGKWDPLAIVDLHVTDGAKFEHDIALVVEPVHAGDLRLREIGRAWRDNVIAELATQGSLPLSFYPEFVVEDDPSTGIEDKVPPPGFSHGYFHLRNRLGMLVETHSWKDYSTRVRITRNAIIAVLKQVAANGQKWLQIAHEADSRALSLADQPVALTYYLKKDNQRIIEFRGYKYTRTISEFSGKLMTVYDDSQPEIWKIPHFADIQPNKILNAPFAGYLVPVAYSAMVAQKLNLHGIEFVRLRRSSLERSVQVFRAETIAFEKTSKEGHQRLKVTGKWESESHTLPAGSLFVPIAQRRSRLVMALLEPQAPDSLLTWGMFNNAFEMKEYMEPYVVEAVAEQQRKDNSETFKTFMQKLEDDPEFKKDAGMRMEFFYRRHSSWDTHYGLYPVFRTDLSPSGFVSPTGE